VLLTKIREQGLTAKTPNRPAAATFAASRSLLASRAADRRPIESARQTSGISPAAFRRQQTD
jgi:hypothetical protein